MTRISRLKRDEVLPAAVNIYDRYLRDRGNVPNMFRTMAHRPEIFETIIAHMEAVLNTGTLPKSLKELVIVRTSQLNRTPYCLASHTTIARKLGWSDVQLKALDDAAHSGEFSEREKVAIHLAEMMTTNPHGYSDVEFARLRSFYSEGEVVELMAAIGLFNYFNRFNDLLQMDPTQPASAEELATAGIATSAAAV
ncbi:MAG: carboxymuconolactone decarboxylase family protein [Edaphobacter sp.]